MKKINILTLMILILVVITIPTVIAENWTADSAIVDGLPTVNYYSTPEVFLDGETWKFISGDSTGSTFYGYQWNGTQWVVNSSIISGITPYNSAAAVTVFKDGSTFKLINGGNQGYFNSFYWSGTTWVADTSIISGLTDVGALSSPEVFNDSGVLKLIVGEDDGVFNGYQWNGTYWVSNSSIVAGLGDVGQYSSPTVYLDGETWKLISGEKDGVFNGYYWSGSTWVSDSSIVTGLVDVGTRSTPEVYIDGLKINFITGENAGHFIGYYINSTGFYLDSNGVTVHCDDANVGDSDIINGVNYTKRTADQITTTNAETTCTSGITDMYRLFYSQTSFNANLSSWDVSDVTNMSGTFYRCQNFNSDVSNWDVSSVTKMDGMFYNNMVFNSDISNWDVSSVTNMASMFAYSYVFNSNVSNWDVSNVESMASLFSGTLFDGDVSSWNVSSVTNMQEMFYSCDDFNSDVSNWDVSHVQNMRGIFQETSFNQNISSWNTSSATNMERLFGTCPFNYDINNWDVSNVERMYGMFEGNEVFNKPLNNWNTSSVTNMVNMFHNTDEFNSDISTWDVSNVEDMYGMFSSAEKFNQSIGNWDMSNVEKIYSMFASAYDFNQPIGDWDLSSVTRIDGMFYKAYDFNQPIGNWTIPSSVTAFGSMFSSARNFNQDISNWDTSSITNMNSMFSYADRFNQSISDWDVSSVTNMDSMFSSADDFNQDLTGWCVSNIASEPTNFAAYGSGLTSENKPIWGTCPINFIYSNLSPENGSILLNQSDVTINFTIDSISPPFINLTLQYSNGTIIESFLNKQEDDIIEHTLENLSFYQEYCWYMNITTQTSQELSDTFCFRPNQIPKLLNFRIDETDAGNFTVKWENEPDMEWVSFMIGTDIMEVRYTTGVSNEWDVGTLIPNKEYDYTFQLGDDTLSTMSDYHTFDFRTFGWNDDLIGWDYKRLIEVDKDEVLTDKDDYSVELILTEENFKTSGNFPSFSNMQENGTDIRFMDYYDLIPLKYNITYWNVPGDGGISYKTEPDEYAASGDWVDYSNAHDEDWNTNAIPDTFGIDYFNYTIPSYSKTSSLYRIYSGEWGWDMSLPADCFGGTKLRFKTEANYTSANVTTYCQNNTDDSWIQLWTAESRLLYETMITWIYETEAHITVTPYHFSDDEQQLVEGVDGDYDTKFLMYYGNDEAISNQTIITTLGTIENATIINDEIEYVVGSPVISNVNETDITTTGINISWDVDQGVDNRIRYSTNPYLLETTYANRLINRTETFLNQKGNGERVLQLDIIGTDYIGIVNVTCSNTSYNSNYTINYSTGILPVEVTTDNLGTNEFLDWEITYTENKTRYRNSNSANFKIENLEVNTTYYYEISAEGLSATTTEEGNFTLGTPSSTPESIFYSYDENRTDDEITICFNVTNLDGAASINFSVQYWNTTSEDFSETTITNGITGVYCKTIEVVKGETWSYRAKVEGDTIGYSDEYTNEFMNPQEFFAGSYITDNDQDLYRQYCPPDSEGYVNLSETCYEQTGYREGAQRLEDWIWIETNITDYTTPYTVNWYDGSTWTEYEMIDATSFQYIKLENLGDEWQTFYITDDNDDLVVNWTKPSMVHPSGKTRMDESKYVSFNITPSEIDYQQFYFRPQPYINTTSFNYCQDAPGGNLYDCMSTTYWGTEGMSSDLVGTKYDRGQLFRGGIWNGDRFDTGVLSYTTPEDRPDSYIQTNYDWTNTTEARNCYSFTNSFFNESIYAENNIENYYFRLWQEDYHFSSYLGVSQEVTWDYIGLFQWEYDPRTYVRDWQTQEDTKLLEEDITRVINGTDVFGGYSKSLITGFKDGFDFDVSEYDIYQSGMQTDGQWNNYLTGKHHRSFVIFNLPDNATLAATDSNSDGISDYDALFTYYLDPYVNDTSEDGWGDKYLIDNGYNPNNPTSHPGPSLTISSPTDSEEITGMNVTVNFTSYTPSEIASSIITFYDEEDTLIKTLTNNYIDSESISENFITNIDYDGDVRLNVEIEDEYGITTDTNYSLTINPIYGCPDEEATNYNPNTEIDDGSCEYSAIEDGIEQVQSLAYVAFGLLAVMIMGGLAFLTYSLINKDANMDSLIQGAIIAIGSAIVLFVGFIIISAVANGIL